MHTIQENVEKMKDQITMVAEKQKEMNVGQIISNSFQGIIVPHYCNVP